MKNALALTLFLLSFFNSYSQPHRPSDWELNSSYAAKVGFAETAEEVVEYAKKDIERGIIFLHLASGDGPVVYMKDYVFEKRYKVFYYEHGCIAPDKEWMIAYNWVVFGYLDKNYGKKWRRIIRSDILGLRTWKWDIKK